MQSVIDGFRLSKAQTLYLYLPGRVANVKDGDCVLWLLDAPEVVTVAEPSELVCRLGDLIPCRSSREQLAESLMGDLSDDKTALPRFRGVLSASLFASVSPHSFISSTESSESVSRLLSDSAGDFSVTDTKRADFHPNVTFRTSKKKSHLHLLLMLSNYSIRNRYI